MLLRVRDLAKRFGSQRVLEGVDLSIHAGELVALVGENAAGKSTLVRCISGDMTPDAGSVEMTGDHPPAVVWQDLGLCENLSAAANLFLGREFGRLWLSDAEMELRAAALLDQLGIDVPDLRRPVGQLSGGQRQSLAIARALVGRPELLILDEPTASLGIKETRAVERILSDLRAAGCGLLLVSHRIEQVFDLADRIVVLRHGRVVADRATTELHPDDVVSMMAGIDTDTTARRQMERLHSLVDQLAEIEPSASVPVIVSALSNAVGVEQVCVHLRVDEPDHGGPCVLRRRASVGVPAPLLAVNTVLPVGDGGGMVGRSAEQGSVVVVEAVEDDPLWADHREAARAGGIRSAWAMPVDGVDGVLGVISVYAPVRGRPQSAVLELAATYTGLAAAAIQRERLLAEVSRRNRTLESLRGMLDALTGPVSAERGMGPALTALCQGVGARLVAIVDAGGDIVEATDASGHRPDAITFDHGTTVALTTEAGDFRLWAWWDAGTEPVGVHAGDVLSDAARSVRLAIEREAVTTSRLEAESLLRTQRSQQEFLTHVSHELRTPLTAIHGYASTLAQTDVEWDRESTSRFLGVIVDESARMGRLVADLLDSSTIAVGNLRLDLDWCDLSLAIEAAVRCVPAAEPITEVTVDDAVHRIWADHDRLEQVLVNLVDNAVRHGDAAGPIRILAVLGTPRTAVRTGTDHATVVITVTDSGAGFAPDIAGVALEPYRRGSTSAPGAGLGLAVCRGIVEAHGGSISIDQEAASGSVVVVLPVEPVAMASQHRVRA